MKTSHRRLSMLLATLAAFWPAVTGAQELSELQESLARFSRDWKAEDWGQGRRGRPGYMRKDDDPNWKPRYLALRDAVRAGDGAVGPLVRMLKTGSDEEQVFAAQALSFLAPASAVDELLTQARTSSNPAVRLYCVDALATLKDRSNSIDWNALSEDQRNRDVRKHISYAIERKGQPVAPELLDALRNIRPNQLGSAEVGKPAPDFTLKTVTGETVRLSSFRGRKSVVLVFIYGDT